MNRIAQVCLAGAVYLLVPSFAAATDFYVSAAGNDANPGSMAAPFRTLSRINSLALRPGDRVLLRGGDTLAGSLSLGADDSGAADAPIVIASYGGGRATIRPGTATGVTVYNTSGIRITNINVVGDGGGSGSGIVFYSDLGGGVKLPFVRIENVEVSGFGRDGISIGSWNGTAGFRDVRITRAWTHRNGRTGILVYAQQPQAHQDVYVGYSHAFENPGISGFATNSGSGIVLGGVSGGTIEWSVASGNGWLNTAVDGPVGIWTYDSTRILIQHNQSFANRTASASDGGGFDLDQNVSDSVVQFNYSHDNDGAGYLLAQGVDNASHYGNTVRYNLSENDGRKNSYGGIDVWGRVANTRIHNNTVRMPPASSGRPAAVRAGNGGIESLRASGLRFHDNVFISTGGIPLLDVSPSQSSSTNLRFEHNTYDPSNSTFAIVWNGGTYGSLSAWRSTGQEMVDGLATGLQGTAPRGTPPADIVLNAASQASRVAGSWRVVADPSAAGRSRLWHPDAGAAKLADALPAPAHYFDITFQARAGRPYRLWMRLQAENDHWGNDSVFAQFSSSVDAYGYPNWQIGTTSAMRVSLEECNGCGVNGWGWEDTGYGSGVLGPLVYFAQDGPQTLRVQTREDGVSIDQIVLSSERFLHAGPGAVMTDVTVLPRQPEGTPSRTVAPPPATYPEIVLRAADVATNAVVGDWHRVADSTAAGGVAVWNPDRGAAKLAALAQPQSYFDIPFQADAGVDYHLWIRMRADGDHYLNDSITVQFSGAVTTTGAPYARIGTTSGASVMLQDSIGAPISAWGWNDTGWASMGTPFRFERSGPQTIRIQQREDGIRIDQIVISSRRYLGLSPGALVNDQTIVAR